MRFELKIELIGTSDPLVWRQIKVPTDINFHQLHLIIQAAFGWENYHLYQFSENGFGDLLSLSSPHDEEAPINAAVVPVASILLNMHNQSLFDESRVVKLKYIYDFGDSWEHDITAIGLDQSGTKKPELVDGGGACPPEDCGGIPGYMAIKESYKTRRPSPIHGEGYLNFDPERFDLKAGQRRVGRVR